MTRLFTKPRLSDATYERYGWIYILAGAAFFGGMLAAIYIGFLVVAGVLT